MSAYDFTLICNSNNGNYTNLTTSTVTYNFDFSLFKDTDYELTFSFLSDNYGLDLGQPMQVLINFGQHSVYTATFGQTNAQTSMVIGNVFPLIVSSTEGSMWCSATQNPPIRMRRPMQNVFTVSLQNLDGDVWQDASTEPLTDYNLVLHFKAILPIKIDPLHDV